MQLVNIITSDLKWRVTLQSLILNLTDLDFTIYQQPAQLREFHFDYGGVSIRSDACIEVGSSYLYLAGSNDRHRLPKTVYNFCPWRNTAFRAALEELCKGRHINLIMFGEPEKGANLWIDL